MAINKLKPEDLNCNIFSCYDYDGLTIQELLCQFFHKINECIEVTDSTIKLAEWLVSEGLAEEVAKMLEKWRLDGTLKQIINVQIFNDLNTKVDTTKAALEKRIDFDSKAYPQGNVIEDQYIRNYRQEITHGKYFQSYQQGPYYYGSTTMNINNGMGFMQGGIEILPGLFEIEDPTEDDLTIIKPWISMKQVRNIPYSTTAWTKGYDRECNYLLELKNNGKIVLDKAVFNHLKDQNINGLIPMNITFPVIKNYAYKDESDRIGAYIKEVEAKRNEMTSIVTVACDVHINPSYAENTNTVGDKDIYCPKLLNYANANIGGFATIMNGDTLTEKEHVDTTNMFHWLMDDTRKMFNENTMFVMGNHDDMSLQPEVKAGRVPAITLEEYNLHMNKGKTGINFSTNNQPYYYADDTVGQCRHIILNSHDGPGLKQMLFKFGAEQLKWLVYALNTTPRNYSIAVYCHVSPMIGEEAVKPSVGPILRPLHDILAHYTQRKSGTVQVDGTPIPYDFTLAQGFLAVCYSGHDHADLNDKIDGVNYVIDRNFSDWQNPNDTYYFSYLQIDTKNRQVRVKRMNFGARSTSRTDLTLQF